MDHDGDLLCQIVLPLMNVNRRTANGTINPNEPHQAQTYITSAGSKSSYAYERMKELLIKEVIFPQQYFVWGTDYKIPVKAGLLSETYVRDQKLSSTYNQEDFAREYMSIWTGGSKYSWIDYDMIKKYRVIVNPEKNAKFNENFKESDSSFYLMSVDVGRVGDQTVITVLKVNASGEHFVGKLVWIEVLEKMHFEQQAVVIKELYYRYTPKEIVLDGTGIGIGLMDFMIKNSVNAETKQVYGPLGSFNDDSCKKIQPRSAPKVIRVIKANAGFNGIVYANLFTCISTGKILFLITEQEAKMRLMSTVSGKKMSQEKKIEKLKPYVLTTILQSELSNLRIKEGNLNQQNIAVEKISSTIGKDKVSSLAYNLFVMKEYEEKFARAKGRVGKGRLSSLMQFN